MNSTEITPPCPDDGQEPVSLYVTVRELLRGACPAVVARRRDATLLMVDPWADRHDVLRLMRGALTAEEFDWYRMASGWPPGMVPLAWLEEAGPLPVPESLWLRAPSDEPAQ